MLVVAQDNLPSGSIWTRLPLCGLVVLPFAFWFFRHERNKEFERSSSMTICPKCETAGEGNADTDCACGGKFVLQSNVRWVEEEADKQAG